MRLSRKLVMVSAAALMAVSPLAAPVVNSSVAQAATKKSSSSKIHNTYGKKSKVKITKAQYFVNQNGKKTSKKAPKNGSYIIWNVKEINGEVYYSIQTDLKYWIPAVDTKGSVQYKSGSTTVTLTTDGKKVVQTEKTVKTIKKTTSKKTTSKKSSTKKTSKESTSKKTASKKSTSTKKSTAKKSTTKKSSSKKSTSSKKTSTKTNSKKASSKKATKKSVKVVKIKAIKKTPVVNTKGKQVKTYMGSKKYNVIGKGITVKGIGTKKINGKTYYALQPNKYYVLAANFKVVK